MFDKRITRRLHIQTIEAKVFRTLITNFLFKSELLSASVKLTLLKALIRFVLPYACPAWGFAAKIHPLKLQHLQNNILRTIGKFLRRTLVRDMYVALHVPQFTIT
jgi:hypothetical protein